MNSVTIIAKSVRFSFIAAAATSVALSGFAMADDAEGNNADKVERIQVTGSRIQRADMETSSPVTVIDASSIIASGATSIDGVLQNMTASGGAMTNAGINNGSQGNASVNLRGLGSSRTLVLVNGRRMIASGTGAASTVDLNTIPVSMIQRVEVLKDGASAVYGTDAIAGVVNIILKRDYDGFEMNVQTGISAEGDGDESSLDFTLGNTFEKGNIVINAQYTKRGEASQADRGYSDCPIAEQLVDGELALYCAGSDYVQGGRIWGDNGADIVGTGGEYHEFSDADRFNYSSDSFLSTPMERLNLSMAGTYQVSDNVTFFTEAMYSKRWSEQEMAPQPIWSSDAWFYEPISAGGWMTDELLPWIEDGEEVFYGRRMVESGNREFAQVVDTIRIVIGLEGELENGWMWDLSYNKGKNDSVDTTANLHNLGSLSDAVLNEEFDPFLQSSWVGDSIAPYIYTEVNSGGSELDIIAATLSGEVYELPAGEVGFAAGYEYRKEAAHYTPDSLTAQGLANDPRVEPTAGEFHVNEIYAELAVPLLSDMRFADQVDLSAAIRYFDYSTFGSDSTWKLGLTWRLTDELMVRGVKSTAFRAPTVDELYGGASPSFEQIVHAATTQDQAEVTVGGNTLLTPEEADIMTVGLVYSPNYVEGLSFTFDYYKTEITNTISSVDNNYIANQCLDASGNKINTGTSLCQSSNIEIDTTGRISFDNGLQNIGAMNTAGYDLNIAYVFEGLGLDWKAGLDTSILDEYEEFDNDGNSIDYKGYITGGVGAYAEVKTNFNLTAIGADWSVTYEARYIGGMDSLACSDAPSECYAPSVDSIIYHDLSATYDATETVRLSAGINNVLDEEPPYFTGNNDSNTDPYTYDVLGRYFFVRASVKF
ncbi:TonB-dependent receptor [Shewanella youngdeokensis]|uniref:TonB-dependent receptor n=1 Tax=Shewanella youngdeokensis TaxID=2999068 RepID=A0ABZ0K1I9_9GAMM|nr:TonB-dependent receptor [Shewanella sp. DAU334]